MPKSISKSKMKKENKGIDKYEEYFNTIHNKKHTSVVE
jgi:hypothetical protein